MRLTLPTRFISTLAATAVALTTFTAMPVYAGDERAARAIATILGLAIVGKIIHDERKSDKKKKRARREYRDAYNPEPPRHTKRNVHRHGALSHSHRDGRFSHDHGYSQPEPRPLPRRVDRKQLPQNCFRSFETRNGPAHMFARRCLERNYKFAHRLPQDCARRVRTREGTRAGFDARCLRRNGYSLARG